MSEQTTVATTAFSFPNFRRFFVGSALSNIGSWFQMLAQALLVLRLTKSGSSLGDTLAIEALPGLLFGPFIGPFIDRVNLRKLLLATTVLLGLEAAALGTLVTTDKVTLTWIYALSAVVGIGQMLQQPSNMTMVAELVPDEAVPNAVSLATLQQSVGRLAGPAAAALVFAWQGPATCYYINAVSYLAILVALLSLRRRGLYPRPRRERSPRQFIEAITYVWHSPKHRGQLTANAFIGALAFNFPLYFSSFTQLVLHAGSSAFGIAESINAAFAVSGGLYLARRKIRPTRWTYIAACLGLGVALCLAAASPNIYLFYATMAIFGLAVVSYTTVNQTALQLNTPRDRLGSVMSISVLGTQGTTPIGALIIGWIISAASARVALAVGGTASLLTGAVLAATVLIAATRSATSTDTTSSEAGTAD